MAATAASLILGIGYLVRGKQDKTEQVSITEMNKPSDEKAAKEKALESGILERANEQAEALVYNFLNNSQNVKNYRLELH